MVTCALHPRICRQQQQREEPAHEDWHCEVLLRAKGREGAGIAGAPNRYTAEFF